MSKNNREIDGESRRNSEDKKVDLGHELRMLARPCDGEGHCTSCSVQEGHDRQIDIRDRPEF
jgi:hypothetical protein